MPATFTAPPLEPFPLDFGMHSTCRQCPVSGCGPLYDVTADPHTITWRPGAKRVTCAYECFVCGCTWTERWPLIFFIGLE